MNDNKNIEFKLAKITTNQFAIIDEIYEYGKSHKLDATFLFARDLAQRLITVRIKFTFLFDENPFMIIEASCQFEISEDSWSEMLQSKSNIKISKAFLSHISMLTIGTIRGILHCKTEDTIYNTLFIPVMNMEEVINEDLILD